MLDLATTERAPRAAWIGQAPARSATRTRTRRAARSYGAGSRCFRLRRPRVAAPSDPARPRALDRRGTSPSSRIPPVARRRRYRLTTYASPGRLRARVCCSPGRLDVARQGDGWRMALDSGASPAG